MELYLVRHGIAEDRSATGDDGDRALTETGREKMTRATEGLRKLKLAPDLVLTSPLRRARETAEILARGLNVARVEPLPQLAPQGGANAVVTALRPYARLNEVMLVGHQPDVSNLASFLLTGSERSLSVDFKRGGVACIDADVSGNPSRGVLKWLLTSRLLRSL